MASAPGAAGRRRARACCRRAARVAHRHALLAGGRDLAGLDRALGAVAAGEQHAALVHRHDHRGADRGADNALPFRLHRIELHAKAGPGHPHGPVRRLHLEGSTALDAVEHVAGALRHARAPALDRPAEERSALGHRHAARAQPDRRALERRRAARQVRDPARRAQLHEQQGDHRGRGHHDPGPHAPPRPRRRRHDDRARGRIHLDRPRLLLRRHHAVGEPGRWIRNRPRSQRRHLVRAQPVRALRLRVRLRAARLLPIGFAVLPRRGGNLRFAISLAFTHRRRPRLEGRAAARPAPGSGAT